MVVRLADSRLAWAWVGRSAGHLAVVRAARPVEVQEDRREVPLADHPADLLIEHRLDTGLRMEHPLRQYRALFQLLHEQLHRPLRQGRLIQFQSGLVRLEPFR